jgi:gliding motility-associated-like protein
MKVSRTQASISRCGTGSTWIRVALQGLVPGVLVLGAGSALAQCTDPCSGNLLSNPDFELNTTVCTTINNGQLYIDQSPVQDWFGTAGVNSPQNGITPDNFNSGCLGNSTNNCGSGAGSIGFFTRVATNGREYVQSQLLEPLEAGAEYCFSVFVKKGSGSTQQPNNGLGIWFTDQQVNITTMNNGASYLGPGSVVNATPYWQLADGDLINTCVQRTGTFCATGGETWIVIGNFRNDANTSIATGGNFNNGYLIIDNLSLTKVCPENTTPLELEASATVLTCGASATLEASGGSGTYTWIPNIGAGAGPFTVAPAETTTYAVVSGSQGTCGLVSDTVEVTITVEPCDHIVTLTAGETCPGGCVDLLTTIENDNVPPYTYTWSDAALVGPGPHSVCPAVTTTYTLTVTDGNGSAVSVDAVAVVLDAPQVTTTSTAVSCPGDNDGSATVTPSGGTAPFQHSWNTLPPQSGTTVTGIASGTYTVTTSDANGCVSSAEVMVEEPAPLVLSVDATDANCGQTDGSATATASGGVGPYDYEWSTTPVQTTATAADLGAGSYTVTATDANGCTATQSITISSTGVGVLQTSATDATCNGLADGSASATLAGGAEPVEYVWNTTPPQNTTIATGLPAGSWTVTATEANGCTSSAAVTVLEPASIVIEVSTTAASCGAANGTALATASGGTGALSIVWDTDPPQSTATASGLEEGSYTVTVTDANGCSATADALVEGSPGPVAGFNGGEACQGAVSTFTSTAANATQWDWDLGDGTSLSGPVVVHSYAEAGTYTVVHTVTDEFGCSDTFATEITIAPVPTAEFAAAPGTGCAPLEVTFANSAPQSGTSCLWDFGDGAGSTACASAAHTYTVPGCYDVTLSVSAAGCTTTLTFPDVVCVEAAPQIGFFVTPDPVSATAPIASFVNNTSGASNFVWTFSAGTPSTSTDSDPVLDLTGVDPGFFEACLVAISAAGCADSLCRIIPLLDDFRVHVPNAFTPNGDGINDVFLPVLIGQNSERYDLSIFDRWGEEIYRTQDADLGWDGRMQNGDVQDGVYVWRLTARASFGTETFERIGHVVLLR